MHLRRAAAAAAALVLAACGATTAGHPAASTSRTASTASSTSASSPATTSAPAPSTLPAEDAAHALFDKMTFAQRVGQLLMVDCPSTSVAAATVTAIRTYHVGAVILDGTSQLGVAQTALVTRQLENDNPSAAKLFIATDQEG